MDLRSPEEKRLKLRNGFCFLLGIKHQLQIYLINIVLLKLMCGDECDTNPGVIVPEHIQECAEELRIVRNACFTLVQTQGPLFEIKAQQFHLIDLDFSSSLSSTRLYVSSSSLVGTSGWPSVPLNRSEEEQWAYQHTLFHQQTL